MKSSFSLLLILCYGIFNTAAYANTLLMKQPTISESHLAFVYAGDIWLANRDGSNPQRLTSHPASEMSPKFSPDGKTIAFTAGYDNNYDVYLISISGGQPKRLTYHSASDTVNGWSNDGQRVVFASNRELLIGRSNQLFEISVEGGFPRKLMDAQVFEGQWSPDGKELAYRPYRQAYSGSSGWRLHRGGSTPPIWIINPTTNKVEKIPHPRANEINPMWIDNRIVFISDRDNVAANLFIYDRSNQSVTQLTKETDWDIRSAASHQGKIVYESGGRLRELDLASEKVTDISITINPDSAQLRPQWKDASKTIENAELSPSGKRIVMTARGDVFTVPTDEGSTRNLTASSGVRESDGIWSHDGQRIAFVSDKGMQHSLIITDQAGSQQAKYLLGKEGYFSLLGWSPDDARIVFEDNHLNLYAIDTKKGNIQNLDRNLSRDGFSISFSADSRWLAYTHTAENLFSQIKIYDFKNNRSQLITDRMSDAASPVFHPDGFLLFTASTNTGPTQVGLDMSSQERATRRAIYLAMLTKTGKSPLLPKSGDEEKQSNAKDDDESNDLDNEKAIRIDFDGLLDRVVALPVAERSYDSLQVASDGALFYMQRQQPGITNEPPGNNGPTDSLYRFDFSEKESVLVKEKVNGFGLSHDGKKILIAMGNGKFAISDAKEKLKTESVSLSGVRSYVDPKQEWRQIFDDVWRMEKEYFYAANLHNLDWDGIYQKYLPLLDHVTRREDLNDVLVQLIAELQVGHNRVGGGDLHRESSVNVGMLGADYEIANGRYRIKQIYTGEKWNPFLQAPLAMPGLGVSAGDYIVAINGVELTANDNIYQRLTATVGQQVMLTVNNRARMKGSRDIVVEPTARENALRLWYWIEGNRKYVAQQTNGKVGYVYLPNTAGAGFQFFNRMFFAQIDKEAMIIDERRNGGGQAANYITDVLSRQYLAGWKDRDGMIYDTPGGSMYGPKVMLIDQDAGSGGDFLPYSFKRMGIGTLIGKRTWGGLIGISANPRLIDGGSLVVPFFRFFTPDGEWRVENEGVVPDIDVDLEPDQVNQGKDSQLDRAIDEVMQQLKTFKPVRLKQAPALPEKVGQ